MPHLPSFTVEEQARVDQLVQEAIIQAQILSDAKDSITVQKDLVQLDQDINQKYIDFSVETLVEIVEAAGLVQDGLNPPATPHTFVRLPNFPVTPGSVGAIPPLGTEDIDAWELRESVTGAVTATGSSTLQVTDSTLSLTPGDYAGETLTFTSGPESGNSFPVANNTSDTFTAVLNFGIAGIGDDFDVTGAAPPPPIVGATVDGIVQGTSDTITDSSLSLTPDIVNTRDIKIRFTSGVENGNEFLLIGNTATSVIGNPGDFANVVVTDTFIILGGEDVVFSTTVNWVPTTDPTDLVIERRDDWNTFDRLANGDKGTRVQLEVITTTETGINDGIDDILERTTIFDRDF